MDNVREDQRETLGNRKSLESDSLLRSRFFAVALNHRSVSAHDPVPRSYQDNCKHRSDKSNVDTAVHVLINMRANRVHHNVNVHSPLPSLPFHSLFERNIHFKYFVRYTKSSTTVEDMNSQARV